MTSAGVLRRCGHRLSPPSAATAWMAVDKLVGQQPVLEPKHKREVQETSRFSGRLERLSSRALLPGIPGFLS